MPSIYDIKPRFQALLRPLVGQLAAAGISANAVTGAATLLSIAAGACIAYAPGARWSLLLLPAVLLVRMALNAIDGMLAREHAQQSNLGALLNELGDVVSDAALYLPLAWVSGFNPALVVGFVVLAVICELAGLAAVQIGAARRYDGPMGKSDRAFVIGALGLLLGLGVPAGAWIDAVIAVAAALLALSIVNRCRRALHEAGRAEAL